MIQKISYRTLYIIMCMTTLLSSCRKDDILGSDGKEGVLEALATISLDWSNTKEDISNRMKGYILESSNDNSMVFSNPQNGQYISYSFAKGNLYAAALIFPSVDEEIGIEMLNKKYDYLGDIDGGCVYANRDDNILATIWQSTAIDKDYSAIGFTPIKSELNGADDTFGISTGKADARAYSATLHGEIKGNSAPDKVGFEYCYNTSFETDKTGRVSCNGVKGDFSLVATGLCDQITVYYRAFEITDGIISYGDILSFETQQGTYTIDGKEYKFIKVEGGSGGSFSIMQTEIPPLATVSIDGEDIGMLDYNNNGEITKGETREFLSSFPIAMRAPTASEWKYAAMGGCFSKGFKYSGSNTADDVAWNADNSGGKAHAPALKEPNELDLYDMSGNYAELCANYSEEELKEYNAYVYKFATTIKDVPAMYFNVTWAAAAGAYGGDYSSESNKCTIESTKKVDTSHNKISMGNFTFRLVYSRPD